VLCLPNSVEFVVSFLSVVAAGGLVVPVDAGAGPERLRGVARDVRPRLLLRSAADRGWPAGVEGGPTGAARAGPPGAVRRRAVPPRADAAILFSAGSTGRPKGAVLGHDQFLAIARTLVRIVGMGPRHRELVLSPMTHSGGWQRVTATLLAGGCVFVFEGTLSIPAVLEEVERHAITGFFAAPPLLRVLLRTREEKARRALRTLRSIESASAPLLPGELERLLRLLPGTSLFFQYGLTECSRAFILDARAHPDRLDTVGLPTPGVRARIVDEAGRRVPAGQEGEIILRAPQRARRYWGRAALTRDRMRGGWLRTGDFGSLDRDGFLRYLGRRDDRINCGGFSFFPAEVERELGGVDGVRDYLVAGVPDPQGVLQDVPWAFVVPETPASWSADILMKRARERLSPHMVPRRVVVVPEIARTPGGKPSRRLTVLRYGPGA
jgi:long-chain acyl-CoA synthetase